MNNCNILYYNLYYNRNNYGIVDLQNKMELCKNSYI